MPAYESLSGFLIEFFDACSSFAYPHLVKDLSGPTGEEGFVVTNLTVFVEQKAFLNDLAPCS